MLLNPDKSEVLLVASQRNAKKVEPGSGVSVAGTKIAYSQTLKSLGVILDQSWTYDQHVWPTERGQGQQLPHPSAAAHQTNVGPWSGEYHRLQHRQHQARLLHSLL